MTYRCLPPLLALAALAVIPACSETRVRPGDTDTDAPDTGDVDTDSDTDTDTDTTSRRGCLEGELDEGWAFETTENREVQVRPSGDGHILLGTAFVGRPRTGGVFLLDIDDWETGAPAPQTPMIGPGESGGGGIFHAPLVVEDADHLGFGLVGGSFDFEDEIRVWTKWPGPNTDIDMPDATIEIERLAHQNADFADLNGDGLVDAVPLGRAGVGVVYGPLSGTYTESDVELLPLPRAGLRLDWDGDGYVDYVGYDPDNQELLVWLGPIVDIDTDTPPDVVLEDSPVWAETAGRPQQAHDIDGDGAREIWLKPPPSEVTEVWSMNYPGSGVFRTAEEISVIIEVDARVSPRSGDLDGDGSMDLVLQRGAEQVKTEVLVLPGPLGAGRFSAADGMSRIFPNDGALISMLGDIDGDGRDDFVVERSYSDTELERSLLYLGCPTW